MVIQREAEFFCDFLLKALDLMIFKLDDAIALRARQVVVVIFCSPLVASWHAAQTNFTHVILFAQCSQEAVNGGETHRWIFCDDGFEDVLSGEVIRAATNDFEDEKSLIGHFQAEITNDLFARDFVDAARCARESFLSL